MSATTTKNMVWKKKMTGFAAGDTVQFKGAWLTVVSASQAKVARLSADMGLGYDWQTTQTIEVRPATADEISSAQPKR